MQVQHGNAGTGAQTRALVNKALWWVLAHTDLSSVT